MMEILTLITFMICSFGGSDLTLNDLGGAQATYTTGSSVITADLVEDGGVPEDLQGPQYTLPCLSLTYDVGAESSCGFRTSLISGEGERLDISECDFLVFLARGAEGGETFNVMLVNASDEMVFLGPLEEFIVGPVTDQWKQARVPLSDFSTVNLADITGVAFDFSVPGTGRIEIDQVAFTALPDAAGPDLISGTPSQADPLTTGDSATRHLIDDLPPAVPDASGTQQPDNDARF